MYPTLHTMLWKFPEEGTDNYWKLTLDEGYCKWERWTDQRPGEHFKAHDQRMFGVYRSKEQSYGAFLEQPFLDISEDTFREIAKILEQKTPEELQASQEKVDSIEHYYWVPVDQE